MKIKYLAFLLAILFINNCGNSGYSEEVISEYLQNNPPSIYARVEKLPINIYIESSEYLNEENLNKIRNVIEIYNIFFKTEIFNISENPSESIDFLIYNPNIIEQLHGFCTSIRILDSEYITQSFILIRSLEISRYVLAHELWHSLGFKGHYDNEECLNYLFTNENWEFNESTFCSEMIEDMNELYPEIM